MSDRDSAQRAGSAAQPRKRPIAGLQEITIEPVRRMRARGFKWDHEIQIALPASYGKTTRSYPVLWVTDGSGYFEMAVKAVYSDIREHVPELIVVAVGVPAEELDEEGSRRGYDFTSTQEWGFTGFGSEFLNRQLATGNEQLKAAGQPPMAGGGAQSFLDFLVKDVRGALAKEFRMADDHTLFGDSGGGLFCAYALLSQPASFAKYICGSPNLFSGDSDVFRIEERYAAAHQDMEAAVFFGAGEAELIEQSAIIPSWGIVSSMARMVEILRLRNYPSLKMFARIFPGEDHLSVIPLNLTWGLRTLWQGQLARWSA